MASKKQLAKAVTQLNYLDIDLHRLDYNRYNDILHRVKVKVKVRTLDIAPLRGTPPQKRSSGYAPPGH